MGKGQKCYNRGGKKRTIKCPHCDWVRKMGVEACNKAFSRHMATAHPEEKFASPDDVPFSIAGRKEEYNGGYDGCRSLPGSNGARAMGMVGQDADGNIQVFNGVSQTELFNAVDALEIERKKKKKKKKRKTTAQKRFDKAKAMEVCEVCATRCFCCNEITSGLLRNFVNGNEIPCCRECATSGMGEDFVNGV